MSQAEPLSASQLEQAFEVFNRVSHELDTSYRELESKVAGLTHELAAARSARLKELAEKERLAHRLSSLLAVLPGGVLIVDARQTIKDVNPEANGCGISQYSSTKAFASKSESFFRFRNSKIILSTVS